MRFMIIRPVHQTIEPIDFEERAEIIDYIDDLAPAGYVELDSIEFDLSLEDRKVWSVSLALAYVSPAFEDNGERGGWRMKKPIRTGNKMTGLGNIIFFGGTYTSPENCPFSVELLSSMVEVHGPIRTAMEKLTTGTPKWDSPVLVRAVD